MLKIESAVCVSMSAIKFYLISDLVEMLHTLSSDPFKFDILCHSLGSSTTNVSAIQIAGQHEKHYDWCNEANLVSRHASPLSFCR